MLSDFFRINLPYGMKRNSSGEWMFFNREYVPIGWNSTERHVSIHQENPFGELPIYSKYKGLTEAKLLKLAWSPDAVRRDEDGNINMVFFYNDGTNPQNNPHNWTQYFEKIQLLSKSEVTRKILT
jgi:hypothetical protein